MSPGFRLIRRGDPVPARRAARILSAPARTAKELPPSVAMRAPDGVTQRAAGSLTLPRWDSANAVFLRTHPRAAVNFSPCPSGARSLAAASVSPAGAMKTGKRSSDAFSRMRLESAWQAGQEGEEKSTSTSAPLSGVPAACRSGESVRKARASSSGTVRAFMSAAAVLSAFSP